MWKTIFATVIAGIAVATLVGGATFAQSMSEKTTRLESSVGSHTGELKSIRLDAGDRDDQLRRMERMLDFLANKAGYAPPEMGTKQ